ncbi:hypothetical protein U1Q18_028187 [Sarracenia purpurea var. burkii]
MIEEEEALAWSQSKKGAGQWWFVARWFALRQRGDIVNVKHRRNDEKKNCSEMVSSPKLEEAMVELRWNQGVEPSIFLLLLLSVSLFLLTCRRQPAEWH